MSKIIAVTGAPGSGKTTVAFKIAQEIYCGTSDNRVVFLSPDTLVPSIALLFPNYSPDELYSLGKLFDSTEICTEDILKNSVATKTMKNFLCLGYKSGENIYSYPEPTQDKVHSLLKVLGEIAEYIVVDCTSAENDLVSKTAFATCDVAIIVVSPDLKSTAYLSSKTATLESVSECCYKVVNILEKDLYIPLDEVKTLLKKVDCTLPYSSQIKQQLLDGRLQEKTTDKKYLSELSALSKKII